MNLRLNLATIPNVRQLPHDHLTIAVDEIHNVVHAAGMDLSDGESATNGFRHDELCKESAVVGGQAGLEGGGQLEDVVQMTCFSDILSLGEQGL